MGINVLTATRSILEAKAGLRIRVVAVYVRLGTKTARGHAFHTVLLRNVRDAETGALLADHLWFNRGSIWRRAGLVAGDVISFEARSIEYRTGYWGANRLLRAEHPPRVEFRLTPPEGLTVIGHRKPWRAVPTKGPLPNTYMPATRGMQSY